MLIRHSPVLFCQERLTVVGGIIVTKHYIDVLAVLVLDKEVCKSCAIFDELKRLSVCLTSGRLKVMRITCALIPGALRVNFPSGPGVNFFLGILVASARAAANKSVESLILVRSLGTA